MSYVLVPYWGLIWDYLNYKRHPYVRALGSPTIDSSSNPQEVGDKEHRKLWRMALPVLVLGVSIR